MLISCGVGPFNREVCEILHLQNDNKEAVAFKVSVHVPLATNTLTRSSLRAYMYLSVRSKPPLRNSASLFHQPPLGLLIRLSYCVRPNSGRIEPGKHVEVQGQCASTANAPSSKAVPDTRATVLLQAMKDEPAPDAKCKDKFLVQSVAVTGDLEFSNVTSIVRLTGLPSQISVH